MAKRSKMQFNGTDFLFRVSKSGFNVDTATGDQLLLDESILYSQVFDWGYIAKPATGTAVTRNLSRTMPWAPLAMLIPFGTGSVGSFPCRYLGEADGSDLAQPFRVRTTTTQIIVHVPNSAGILGVYYFVYRYPSPT